VAHDELVEPVEQRAEAGGAGREVERERPAGGGERQQPGVALAEPLEHGHERRRGVRADQLERAADGRFGAERQHILVLPETARAVDPVPVPYPVERVEELADRLQLPRAQAGRLPVPRLVG